MRLAVSIVLLCVSVILIILSIVIRYALSVEVDYRTIKFFDTTTNDDLLTVYKLRHPHKHTIATKFPLDLFIAIQRWLTILDVAILVLNIGIWIWE